MIQITEAEYAGLKRDAAPMRDLLQRARAAGTILAEVLVCTDDQRAEPGTRGSVMLMTTLSLGVELK